MKSIIVIVLVGILAFGVTGPKLVKMCQIKGWIPGAEEETVMITQKWNQTADIHPSGRNTFWIAWTEEDIKKVGSHRTNVTKEKWNTIKIGDSLEILHIKGNRMVYLRDGIFVDVGNFIFDIILLVIELGLMVRITTKYIKNRKAYPSKQKQHQP